MSEVCAAKHEHTVHNAAFDIKCTVLLFLQFLADLIYSNREVAYSNTAVTKLF